MPMMEMELPRGYDFCPTDEEAIQYYLKKKVTGMPLDHDGIVLERNPYDEKQLPDILAAAEKRDIYFFTKLMRKGRAAEGSKNFSRRVGNMGTWRADHTVDIKKRGSLIGTAKTLAYTEKGSTKNRLIMTEYALPTKDSSLPYNPSKDWVLCRIKKKGKSKNSKKSGSNSVNAIQEAPLLLPAADHHTLEAANGANSDYPSSMVIKEEATTPTNIDESSPFSTGDEFTLLGALQDVGFESAATPITDFRVSTGDEFKFPTLENIITLEDINIRLSDALQPVYSYTDNVLNYWTEADQSEPFVNRNYVGHFWTDDDLQFAPSFMHN